MENKDLSYLKKHYGEDFAHLCRELFPTLLEKEGVLSGIISSKFAPTKSLYYACVYRKDDFRNYINSFVNEEKSEDKPVTKTPEELLDEAGYILYPECQTEKDIQSFKKYWASGEELCTFRGGRLDSCRVWFAIKKDIDKIKREDFSSPKRQDEYGTSAISIQFSRGKQSTLSIKNRYNHTVFNPDSTFSNNLDNIIPGLTQSFAETYQINLIREKDLSFVDWLSDFDFRLGNDEKYYRVNLERNNICYCENNVILAHGRVEKIDKARYILAENYLIDLQKYSIEPEEKFNSNHADSFTESIGKIKDITLQKGKNDQRTIIFTPEEGEKVELTLNRYNQIVSYSNPNVKEIDYNFLNYNFALNHIDLPNLKIIHGDFLSSNTGLESINFPNLTKIGSNFLNQNANISSLNMPKLEVVGLNFLSNNTSLTTLSLPNLSIIGSCFLPSNRCLREINLPNLVEVGDFCLCNINMISLSLPKLQSIGSHGFYNAMFLENLNFPNLTKAEDSFLSNNTNLKVLSLPNLKTVGSNFLAFNKCIEQVDLPKLESADEGFLCCNNSLKSLCLPKVTKLGYGCLYKNHSLEEINFPNLMIAKDSFLCENNTLNKVNLPRLEEVGAYFLNFNNSLKEISLPSLKKAGDYFLYSNRCLKSLNLPNLEKAGEDFLGLNNSLVYLSLPKLKDLGYTFLYANKSLKKIYAPNTTHVLEKFKDRLVDKPIDENEM